MTTFAQRIASRLAAATAVLLGSSAALVAVGTPPALAAVESEVGYAISADDPTLAGRLGSDSTPCVQDGTAGVHRYRVAQFRVSATGTYTFADSGPQDGRLGVYSGVVDPADPAAGCLAFFDTVAPANQVSLTAGTTYSFLQTAGVDGATGDFGFSASGDGTVTVLAQSQTVLNSAPNPAKVGKPVTLSAQVTGESPTGTVQFFDGTTPLGTAALNDGLATLTVSRLSIGTHALSAVYAGDAANTTSSGSTTQVIKRGKKPTVTLKVSRKQVAVGSKIKLTWKSQRAERLVAKGSWRGVKPKRGTKTLKVKTLGVHIYKLKATNASGKASARVKVIAVRGPKEFTVTVPTTIVQNDSDLLVRTTGLDAKERFKVFLDDQLLIKGFADKAGRVRALAPIPRGATEGVHTLSVVGSRPDRRGEVEISVVRPKQLTLAVDASPVIAKTNQTVTVTGLVAGETVTLLLDGESLVEGVADSSGTFVHTFSVGTKKGTRNVEAIGQIVERNGEVSFEVIKGL